MIDFENEIKKFEKLPETQDIEQVVFGEDLTDISDLLKEVIEDKKGK